MAEFRNWDEDGCEPCENCRRHLEGSAVLQVFSWPNILDSLGGPQILQTHALVGYNLKQLKRHTRIQLNTDDKSI